MVMTGCQDRAGFDASMCLLRFAPLTMSEAVACAELKAFQAKRPVAIPGLSNVVMAKAATLAPRPLLLRTIAALQPKSGDEGWRLEARASAGRALSGYISSPEVGCTRSADTASRKTANQEPSG